MSAHLNIARIGSTIAGRMPLAGDRVSLLTGAMVGSVGAGAVMASDRGSEFSQTGTYLGVVGLVAAAPLYAFGKIAMRGAARNADRLIAAQDLAPGMRGVHLLEHSARYMRPARMMGAGSVGLFVGALVGNACWANGRRDGIREMTSTGQPT